jgi:hypothetical protein
MLGDEGDTPVNDDESKACGRISRDHSPRSIGGAWTGSLIVTPLLGLEYLTWSRAATSPVGRCTELFRYERDPST